MPKIPAKPFQDYTGLLQILSSRGMYLSDFPKAQKKLEELGYYRLSGYWYIFRQIDTDSLGNPLYQPYNLNIPVRKDDFIPNTNFFDVLDLYLFDKKLRLLMLDALERIEIYIRSIIAHEMGRFNPMAYEDSTNIKPQFLRPHPKNKKILWQEWVNENDAHIRRSHEDYILSHQKMGKQIPIWVAVETWDFGLMSRYFSMLKGKFQNIICTRVDKQINPYIL